MVAKATETKGTRARRGGLTGSMRAPAAGKAGKKPKTSKGPATTEPAATAAEKPAAAVETPMTAGADVPRGQIGTVTVTLPIDPGKRQQWYTDHVDFRLTPHERRTVGHLLNALQRSEPPHYTMPSIANRPGRLIQSSSDVLRYVLEKIAVAAGVE